MKKINVRAKGQSFERDIAHLFAEMFGKNFNRTPGSGAFTGGKNRTKTAGLSDAANNTLTGDIIVPTGFPFSVECKNYASLPWHQILNGKCLQLDSWLAQASVDAGSINQIPMVIFKISRAGTFFVIPSDSKHQLVISDPTIPCLTYKGQSIYSMHQFSAIIDVHAIKLILMQHQ